MLVRRLRAVAITSSQHAPWSIGFHSIDAQRGAGCRFERCPSLCFWQFSYIITFVIDKAISLPARLRFAIWFLGIIVIALLSGCVSPFSDLAPIRDSQVFEVDATSSDLWAYTNAWLTIALAPPPRSVSYADRPAGVILARGQLAVTYEERPASEFVQAATHTFPLPIEVMVETRDGFVRVDVVGGSRVPLTPTSQVMTSLDDEQLEAARQEIRWLIEDLGSFLRDTAGWQPVSRM